MLELFRNPRRLLLFCFDYTDNPQAWRHSNELLAREVMPRFRSVVPK